MHCVIFKLSFADHWESLQRPADREQEESIIGDVWDGSALRPLRAKGRFFSTQNNLALSMSTDGVPLFKSSPISLWPVYLIILNLPAKIRMNAENILLAGLWVGPTKPPMNLLLGPIMKSFRQLRTLGMAIKTATGLKTFRTKLVLGIFDLPAKAAALCAKQFNGEFGCSVCLHPGKRLTNGARVYLPDIVYPDRTHAEILSAAREAQRTNLAVTGIRKRSPLADNLDLVASVPVDYMHAVLEGVVRWLTQSWFNSTRHGQPQYIGRDVSEIDAQLLKQRPPSELSRPPRSIKKHLNYWKASELRSWMLFYSLPLLLEYLPSLYWHHYALLACALHILLQEKITLSQIDAAEQMLRDFYVLLPDLYGESSCTANAHLLSHLCKYVRLWGPLWTHSAFGYESKNGQLKHLFHGKSDVINQLLFNVDVRHTLQLVHHRLEQCETERTMVFIDRVSHVAPRTNMTQIAPHSYIVGQFQMSTPTAEQTEALGHVNAVQAFTRLFKDGILYYSTSYTKGSGGKRNNMICSFRGTDDTVHFGQIELFVKTPEPSALLREFRPLAVSLLEKAGPPCRTSLVVYQQVDLLSSFIIPVGAITASTPLVSIPIKNILGKVVLLAITSTAGFTTRYVIKQPNHYERH